MKDFADRAFDMIESLQQRIVELEAEGAKLRAEADRRLEINSHMLHEAKASQSDAQPRSQERKLVTDARGRDHLIDPAPPHPDASGLIEAAEWHEVTARHAEEMAAASDNHPDFVKAAEIHRYSADVFRNWIERARAADRSAHGEVIPDCPTEGVAARAGNGG